jgi:hypothetical protein
MPGDGRQGKHSNKMDLPSQSERAANTPPEVLALLKRLEIDWYSSWVWMTTKDRRSPELPRFRVNDGGPRRYVPLHPEDAKAFEEYSIEILGMRIAPTDLPYGLLQVWEEQRVDVRYMRVQWQQSVLYAEYTATRREGQTAAIRGAHLAHAKADRDKAWAALDLVFNGIQRGRPGNARRPDVIRPPGAGNRLGRVQPAGRV